jgi:hypothetical protein
MARLAAVGPVGFASYIAVRLMVSYCYALRVFSEQVATLKVASGLEGLLVATKNYRGYQETRTPGNCHVAIRG